MVVAQSGPAVREGATHGDPFAPLLARGISGNVIRQARISAVERYGYPYWRYPVHDGAGHLIAWRYKRAGDDASRRKYDWGTEHLPARTDAVYNIMAIATGTSCVLAAGEADTWLLATCGVRSCSLLAGEDSVPAAAVDALAARSPSHVSVIYDNDETGRRGAGKVTLALRARGIASSARALPASVGSKGDLTDLYRVCGADRTRFTEALRGLPEVDVPAPAQDGHSARARLRAHTSDGASPIERFKARHDLEAVIDAAGVPLKAHQGGAYLQGRCPFHDDRSPSLVVWPQRGYWKCYGCGARGDVIDFIERMERCRRGAP